jgi:hypothetical protein
MTKQSVKPNMQMSKTTRMLLMAEVIVGFGFVFALWLFCLLMSFLWIFALLFHGRTENFPMLLLSAAGAYGLWSMFQLGLIVFYPEDKPSQRFGILLGLLMGYLAIVWFLYPFGALSLGVFFMMLPIFVSLHFLYLARAHFLQKH